MSGDVMSNNIPKQFKGKSLIHQWPYLSEEGDLIGIVKRYEDGEGSKDVVPFFKREGDQRVAGIDLDPRPLYGLDRLASHPKNEVIFVVEGEKCAKALHYLNCCAVTSLGGSQAAHKADWSKLDGSAKIIILPDNDEAGSKYAEDVQTMLSALPTPPQVEVINLSGLPPKGDVVDWIAKHLPEWDGYSTISPDKAAELKKHLFDELTVENASNSVNQLACGTDGLATLAEIATRRGEWPELKYFQTPAVGKEPYPLDALPDIIRAAVEEVTNYSQAPIGLVASSALAVASLATQGYVNVKRPPNLISPSSLNFLVLADSGERKTSVADNFLRPIRGFEDEHREQNKELQIKYRCDKDAWEAKLNGTRDAIKKAAKKSENTSKLEQQLLKLKHEEPTQPKVAKLIYNDFTPEALSSSIASSWPSASMMSSEGGTILGGHGMRGDAVMSNLALLNQLWDGVNIDVVRRTRESYKLENVRFTTLLMVQPGTFERFTHDSSDLSRDIGFIARFLFCYPESTQGTRFFKDLPEETPNLDRFNHRIGKILKEKMPLNDRGGVDPIVLEFDDSGKKAWVHCYNAIEQMLGHEGALSTVRDIASKSADNAARLACVFEYIQNGDHYLVSEDSMERANKIAAWHLNEALSYFSNTALQLSKIDKKAKNLSDWLIKHCREHSQTQVSRDHIMRLGTKATREKAALDPVLKVLEGYGHVRRTNKGVEINPKLLTENDSIIPAVHPLHDLISKQISSPPARVARQRDNQEQILNNPCNSRSYADYETDDF